MVGVEEPKPYRLETTVKSADATVVDTYSTTFGIRSVRFDVNNGFFLNEKPVKLKGTCNHQDHAVQGNGAAGSSARLRGSGLRRN